MQFKLNDIEEIAAKFTDSETGIHRDLILLAGLPGTGKTTVAKEFARQTQALHFDIDEVKRVVVPADEVTEDIDPPEYRFKYYSETIRRLPELFAKTSAQTVILDETFHLRNFRDFWNESARALNIRVHWIEVVCDEEIVKERLSIGKNRGNHILGNKAIPMYLLFKEAFEPMKAPYEVVDTSKDVIPQIQRIIEKQAIGEKQ
ncbi:MAG: ATP-binding protein [Deltaproteobacteria bacterium]|nr:ATP-binding protein [Deltaproteobacteria bacterium]